MTSELHRSWTLLFNFYCLRMICICFSCQQHQQNQQPQEPKVFIGLWKVPLKHAFFPGNNLDHTVNHGQNDIVSFQNNNFKRNEALKSKRSNPNQVHVNVDGIGQPIRRPQLNNKESSILLPKTRKTPKTSGNCTKDSQDLMNDHDDANKVIHDKEESMTDLKQVNISDEAKKNVTMERTEGNYGIKVRIEWLFFPILLLIIVVITFIIIYFGCRAKQKRIVKEKDKIRTQIQNRFDGIFLKSIEGMIKNQSLSCQLDKGTESFGMSSQYKEIMEIGSIKNRNTRAEVQQLSSDKYKVHQENRVKMEQNRDLVKTHTTEDGDRETTVNANTDGDYCSKVEVPEIIINEVDDIC